MITCHYLHTYKLYKYHIMIYDTWPFLLATQSNTNQYIYRSCDQNGAEPNKIDSQYTYCLQNLSALVYHPQDVTDRLWYTPGSDLIDWCYTARQHKIGQFVPIYQGDYWLRRLRIDPHSIYWYVIYDVILLKW